MPLTVEMERLKVPGQLSFVGNVAQNYQNWLQRFELYCKASGYANKAEHVQCALFLHVAGEEAIKIHNTMTFLEAEEGKIKPLKDKFKKYCEPKKKITYLRHPIFH